MSKEKVYFENLTGLTYQEAWDYQTVIHKKLIEHKRSKRNMSQEDLDAYRQEHRLLFCEHKHVYTLGKSGSIDHLLIDEEKIDQEEIEFFKINRGGDITYHGPGQLTGYPIFDLDHFFNDVHMYVRFLEEAVIMLLEDYGLKGERIDGYTGVWIIPEDNSQPARKICAIGVHLSRWVSMHGFALNVNTDLSYFNYIIPCGIQDENKTVTSLQSELGKLIPMDEVKERLKRNFAVLFDYEYV